MASIYKRGKVYYSSVYINGKQIRKPLSTDQRIAENRLADLIKDRDSGKYGHPTQKISWPAFKEKYLFYSEGSKQGSTPERDKAAISSFEKFYMPDKLEHITPERIERWKAERRAAGKGHATINRDINAIKAMMKKAVEWGYLESFNGSSIKELKETRGKLLFYSPKELKQILEKAKTTFPNKSHTAYPYDWVTIGLLCARAGLRLSEVLHLSWDDVDFKRNLLSITSKPEWNPKDYEQRHIPLTKDLQRHLKAIRMAAGRPQEWVIGLRPSKGTLSAYFRKIVRKAGLRGSLHTLRHTFASHLVQAGVSLYVVQKLLGHASPDVTQRYAHLAPSSMDDAIKKLPTLVINL